MREPGRQQGNGFRPFPCCQGVLPIAFFILGGALGHERFRCEVPPLHAAFDDDFRAFFKGVRQRAAIVYPDDLFGMFQIAQRKARAEAVLRLDDVVGGYAEQSGGLQFFRRHGHGLGYVEMIHAALGQGRPEHEPHASGQENESREIDAEIVFRGHVSPPEDASSIGQVAAVFSDSGHRGTRNKGILFSFRENSDRFDALLQVGIVPV